MKFFLASLEYSLKTRVLSEISELYINLVLFLLPFPVYDGIRLFMWAIPYFCIIPALTVFFIYKKYKTLFSKTLFFSSLMLFFFHVYNFILITPYQYTYLNIFNGNKEQRYKKFENDYWGGSIKELVKKTNFNKSNVIMISSCGVNLNVVKKYMNKKGYKKLNFVNVNSAQYILMTNRTISVNANPKNVSEITNCFDKYPGKDVYSVKRNGQILSVIRELKKIN